MLMFTCISPFQTLDDDFPTLAQQKGQPDARAEGKRKTSGSIDAKEIFAMLSMFSLQSVDLIPPYLDIYLSEYIDNSAFHIGILIWLRSFDDLDNIPSTANMGIGQ